MLRRKTVVLWTALIALLFLFSTYYLLTVLPLNKTDVLGGSSVEELIWIEYNQLPAHYKTRKGLNENFSVFVDHLRDNFYANNDELTRLWREVDSWVSNKQLVDTLSPKLGRVIVALKNAPIIKADLDSRGTQLKLLLTLQGHQQVVFKPKWYEKDQIINGEVYAGKDRYGSELVAFILSVLLGKPLVPISSERTISLRREILPVATKRLVNTSFVNKRNQTCVYGVCFYCKKEDPVCDDSSGFLTGAVIFNIDRQLKVHRSPWQRTYKKGKKAAWQQFSNYCSTVKEKLSKRRLLDLIDTSVFDFLIQNGDRHHYETLDETVVLLDNGKGLGNPTVHHIDVLAPLYQCCMLRQQTWNHLLQLTGGRIREYLKTVPGIDNFVTDAHLRAMDDRLLLIFATVEYCKRIKKNILIR